MSTTTNAVPTGRYDHLIGGVPGLAVRLGRALQRWGRESAVPLDRERARLEFERREAVDATLRERQLYVLRHR